MVKLLEWLAFGGSLFSVYLYGRSRLYGPYAGVVVAILFMVYGLAAGIYAAALSNIVFFGLHLRNLLNARRQDMGLIKEKIAAAGNLLAETCHRVARESGWWAEFDMMPEQFKKFYVATKLCLIHSEVSEAMEGQRKDLRDDHLPHRSMLEVELADAVIRIGDLAGALGLDLGGAIADKMEYNMTRPDHRPENRALGGGKSF